ELAHISASDEPLRMEYRRLARDGRIVWVMEQSALIRDDNGYPRYWQTVQIDITARKRTESALHDSEARFRSAFAHAAIGMDLVDLQSRFVQVNAALCSLTGYSDEELLTKTIQEITHVDDREGDGDLFRSLVAGEVLSYEREKRFVR